LYSKDSPFFSLMRRGKIVGSLNTSKLFVWSNHENRLDLRTNIA
jgi:hypothetical protein